ncbi:hypothetical protein ACFL2D_01200 [Patescibacteria group bacterium]
MSRLIIVRHPEYIGTKRGFSKEGLEDLEDIKQVCRETVQGCKRVMIAHVPVESDRVQKVSLTVDAIQKAVSYGARDITDWAHHGGFAVWEYLAKLLSEYDAVILVGDWEATHVLPQELFAKAYQKKIVLGRIEYGGVAVAETNPVQVRLRSDGKRPAPPRDI